MKQKYIYKIFNKQFLVLLILILPLGSLISQTKRYKLYDDYIEKYKDVAIDQMKKYKIPASITLAQGLLESGAGQSKLTKESNNHFGIKCHSDWKGQTVRHNDDFNNECFRKYKNAHESFEDHSKFLLRPRYKALFDLKITDYRGWSKGLQQAGYATNKAYANSLIRLIETYELYKYDNPKYSSGKTQNKGTTQATTSAQPTPQWTHTPYKDHNLVYVVAKDGDTYEAIATEFKFKVKDICKYNEVPENFPLKDGDIVYLQKKKSKADKPNYEHVVQIGESMHSISQQYGIRVKNLYKMNKKDFEYVPTEGDVLRLR